MGLSGILDDLIQESLGWVPYTQLANLTGRPAISVPLRWTQNGLPLGVQFVGKLGADGELPPVGRPTRRGEPVGSPIPGPGHELAAAVRGFSWRLGALLAALTPPQPGKPTGDVTQPAPHVGKL